MGAVRTGRQHLAIVGHECAVRTAGHRLRRVEDDRDDAVAERALELLDEMRESGPAPSVHSFNAAITACEKAGQWERALALLDEMRARGVAPDVGAINEAMRACARGKEWQTTLALLAELKRAGAGRPRRS